jgi:S-adenosylmethionine:diacylglycerol 3-amino-3-carboxypropyl transferase
MSHSGLMEKNSTAATGWERGRFDARRGPEKLLFGQMHEDATIEMAAFRPGGRVFCIASAGCTAMKLANSYEVVAVDTNPLQFAYVGRRLAGGAIERGTAERILAVLRALAPLAGWYPSRLRAFLELSDLKEQSAYWRRHLDTRRLRTALRILFSRRMLGLIYSDALLESVPPNFGRVIRRRLERGFATHPNHTNPYARAMLVGEFGEEAHSESGSFAQGRIKLVQADAADYLQGQPAGSFDGFTLSNILDGANAAYKKRLFAAVKHAAAPEAVVVLRSFREPLTTTATNRAAEDRSMIWGIVDVQPAAML